MMLHVMDTILESFSVAGTGCSKQLISLQSLQKESGVEVRKIAAGLGFGSFADAVAAYNAAHGTNYSVDQAKAALGQK